MIILVTVLLLALFMNGKDEKDGGGFKPLMMYEGPK